MSTATSPDTATWRPTDTAPELTFGRGRAPRMTHQHYAHDCAARGTQ